MSVFGTSDPSLYDVLTRAAGPGGALPLTAEQLRHAPSGDLFGWIQNAGMGWNPARMGTKQFLILSTHGGVRAPPAPPSRSATTPATRLTRPWHNCGVRSLLPVRNKRA